MKPTKEFFERVRDQFLQQAKKDLISAERNDAVMKFCQYIIENGIYVEESPKLEGAEEKDNGICRAGTKSGN